MPKPILLKSTSEILLNSVFLIVILWSISRAKVIQMEHQIDTSGMHVENPLELQMLFSELIFLDNRELTDFRMVVSEKAGFNDETTDTVATFQIAFFLDFKTTLAAGFTDIENLLGRMLLVTQLDGKAPTMELAEVIDICKFSEEQFAEKVKFCRKIIIFSNEWPFDQNITKNNHVLSVYDSRLFHAPAIPSIMTDIELKKAFAAGLKNYFLEA